MRVLFAGSPEIAVPSLQALAERHELVAVLTNPPSAKGRGLCFSCTPVTEAATRLGIPVLSPERLGPIERDMVAALSPDILVVFAYGHIFGPKFMALFPRGGINAHPSLLPRWRGCAPIPFAILNRDNQTGVSVQCVAPRMDSGDILSRRYIDLDGTETTESLSLLSATIGADMLIQAVDDIASGHDTYEAQDESLATYCHALTKDEGVIDWASSALDIDARCRAFNPWPGTYSTIFGERLSLLKMHPYIDETCGQAPGTVVSVDKSRGIMVQTGEGLVALERLQLRGKKPMHWKDFANGARGLLGSCLGATRL